MKKKYAFILSAVILAGMLVISLSRMCKGTAGYYEHQATASFDNQEYALLRNGDVILRHGFGWVSNTIAKYAHDDYAVSHCGVLVQTKDSAWYVIHTVSNSLSKTDGMQTDPLSRFLTDSHENSIVVQRFVSQDSNAGNKIAFAAWNYYKQRIPFDDEFNFEDSTEFFCTEMLWHVFKNAVNVNLLNAADESEYHIMHFAMLFDTLHFATVINQFDENKSKKICR